MVNKRRTAIDRSIPARPPEKRARLALFSGVRLAGGGETGICPYTPGLHVPGDGMPWRLLPAVVALACGLAAGMWPRGAMGDADHAAVRSSDLHFLVTGPASGENLKWVEQLSAQEAAVEKWVGREVPFAGHPPIAVSFRTRAEGTEPVIKVQGWEDGRFLQRLAAPGAWGLDDEDFAEAACWLLLNRLAAEETPQAMRFGMGAEAPDWLACGLCQAIAPALRARNREWIVRDVKNGRTMRLGEIVKMERLPAGRWREKAYAGAAVEFLLPSGAAGPWGEVFAALGRREALSARWLRGHCPALAAGKNPEDEWRAWLVRLASAEAADRQDRSLRQEALLVDILNVRPRDWSPDVPDGVPEELFARELASWRGQEWCVALAGRLLVRTKELAVASPPELREAVTAYSAYFAQLTTPPKPKAHWWQRSSGEGTEAPRPPDDAAWALALNQLWQRAERLHQQFLETTLARKRYVDGWDVQAREFAGDSDGAEDDDGPRTPGQQYLDRFEAVF